MVKAKEISSLDEADGVLRALGAAERTAAQLQLSAQAQIDGIKAKLAEQLIVPAAVAKTTRRILAKFVEKHHTLIEERSGGKTVQLTFGRLGLRTPPPALKLDKGFTESDVIALIKRQWPKRWDAFVQTDERLRKDDLKLLDDDDLALVGLHIDQEDVAVIEPAEDIAPMTEVA